MREQIILLSLLLLFSGCGRPPEAKGVLVKVNNYEITTEEFEADFKNSPYAGNDTLEARKEFLNLLINQKLILQDAQARGLDKDKDFLKMIEKFWEQSLLKLTLERKSQEIAGSAFVSDQEIKEAYDQVLNEGKTDKTHEQMSKQIKWELTQSKETGLMDQWVDQLRKKAAIKINDDLLKDR